MSRYYDKNKIKEILEPEQIYDLLELWGGNPTIQSNYIISDTICHNLPNEGSHKLYYYFGTRLFVCYTHCGDAFDIFELCIKVRKLQHNQDFELYDAMDYIAGYFGIQGEKRLDEEEDELSDYWDVLKRHNLQRNSGPQEIILPEYNPIILTRFSYPRIQRWEEEGISKEVSRKNLIGYYPGGEQITIPHYDINDRLIGIRGRALGDEEAQRYGKYRPLTVNKVQYNHPLSMNLYHLNKTKDNISQVKTAIIFESEKSCLQYQSYYGEDNDISVACCGSSISSYQIFLLQQLGVNEIIIAFDRQFEAIGDEEFMLLKNKLIHFYDKYSKNIKVTAIFDKNMILPYKASPVDLGPEKFEQLLKERIIPYG